MATQAGVETVAHSIDGVLIVAPVKRAESTLPFLVIRKILGIGHGGVYDSRRSTARGERMSMPWAPSPPMHFCHEKVTTSRLAHGMSIANTAEVASQMARPARSAGGANVGGTRTPAVVPLYCHGEVCAPRASARGRGRAWIV